MKIEFARSEDRSELKAIYRVCFPDDPEEFWDFQLKNCMDNDNVLICREDGRIISAVQLLPQVLKLAENHYPVQYIYAAATLPKARGRGIMGLLLQQGHEFARKRGQRFSVLITQNDSLFAFYKRFGYLDCGKMGVLYPDEGEKGLGRIRIAKPEDVPQMLALYQNAQRGILSVSRTQQVYFIQQTVYGKNVLVYDRQGIISAYGVKVGNRMLEVVGPDSSALLTDCGVSFGTTLPKEGLPLIRNGCVLPLDVEAQGLLIRQRDTVYLNLMWN